MICSVVHSVTDTPCSSIIYAFLRGVVCYFASLHHVPGQRQIALRSALTPCRLENRLCREAKFFPRLTREEKGARLKRPTVGVADAACSLISGDKEPPPHE